MASLSVTEAWNETAALLKREGRLIFPLAFLLMALPGAILQAMIPPSDPGAMPVAGPWLYFLPISIVSSIVGALAISWLALTPGTSLGEALQVAVRRILPVIGALILLSLAGGLLMLPLMIVIALLTVDPGGGEPQMTGGILFGSLAFAVLVMFFWVRLMLMTPVAAVEKAGPLAMIARSWALTRGHFWKLLGFLLLLTLVAGVTMLAVSAVGGLLIILIAGQPEPGSVAMFLALLLSALLQAVVSAVFTVFLARIYAQLTGRIAADVFT